MLRFNGEGDENTDCLLELSAPISDDMRWHGPSGETPNKDGLSSPSGPVPHSKPGSKASPNSSAVETNSTLILQTFANASLWRW